MDMQFEYYPVPPIDLMPVSSRISDDMLAQRLNGNFTNLKICRKGYGEVYFPGEIYVENIDIEQTVRIERNFIEVYHNDECKPEIGSGLNKPAIVTFNNVWLNKSLIPCKKDGLRKIAEKVEQMGAHFLSYCFDSGDLRFSVPHFSKYGLNDSDEELEIPPTKEGHPAQTKQKEMGKQDLLEISTKRLKPLDNNVLNNNQSLYNTQDDSMHLELDISDTENLFDVSTPPDMSLADKFGDVFSPRQSTLAYQFNSQRIIGMKASFFQDDYKEVSMDLTNVRDTTIHKYSSILKSVNVPVEKLAKKPDKTVDLLEHHTLMTSTVDWHNQEVMPFVGSSKYLKQLPKFENSIIFGKQNYIADIGCFKGRSFRVGWGPQLEFAHIGKPLGILAEKLMDNYPNFSFQMLNDSSKVTVSGFAVHKSKLESISTDHGDILLQNLVKSLEIQLSFNNLTVSEETPFFKPKQGVDLLHAHFAFSESILSEFNSYSGRDRLIGMKEMWELCLSLWGNLPNSSENPVNSYNHRDDRKFALSNWLMKSTKERLHQEVQSQKFNPDGYLPTLYSFLTGRQISEACELAMEHEDWRLSLLLAQASSSSVSRVLLQRQLENWHQYRVDDFIDKQRLKIYSLLAGSLIWNPDPEVSVNCCENLDWKRALAVHLWYHCPATASISDAVAEFDNSFQGASQNGKYSQPPYPTYIENDPDLLMTLFDEELDMGTENVTTPYDICYHLLKLYCDRTTRLDKLLAPLTYCPSHLDYSNSWLLFQVLLSLGYEQLPAYQTHQLHNGFATQLESVGLWEWAIFVLLHIQDPAYRKAAVMEYLNKHVSLKNEEEYELKEAFLMEKLGVPKKWIYAAKALLARTLNSPQDEAWCLLKSCNWNLSHRIIMKHIAPNCIINENFSYLKEFLEELSSPERSSTITDWSNGGEVYLEYMKICEAVDYILKERVNAYDLEALKPRLLSLGKHICNLRCITARETLCQSEMAKKTAALLRAVLELSKAKEGGRVNEHYLAPFLSKLPMPEDYALQELRAMTRSYMLELTEK